MGDKLEFFGDVLRIFLVFCLFYYYICHIHACRAVLRVHDIGINHCNICFGNGIVAVIQLHVWISCNW